MRRVLAVILASALVLVVAGVLLLTRGDGTAAETPTATHGAIETTPTPEPTRAPERAGRVPFEDGVIHVEFLGDSLTYGLFATTEADGYRPRVVAALGQFAEVESVRWGDPGYTSRMVAEQASVSSASDLVVVALGTNDARRLTLEEFARDYASLIDEVRSAVPEAVLVCLGVWTTQELAATSDPVVATPCRANDGIFVPVADLYDARGTRGPVGAASFAGVRDDMHPNDEGFAAIAARIERMLGI